jgi:hypothetical protein
MEQKTIFEQLGGTYSRQGDYLLPNLKMPEQPEYTIGVWGQRRRRYLKKHRPILYTNLLTSCKLSEHLAEIDEECNERMESLVKAMANQEGVTEVLKAADQMAWVRRMNNIRNRAEEIVNSELIYV